MYLSILYTVLRVTKQSTKVEVQSSARSMIRRRGDVDELSGKGNQQASSRIGARGRREREFGDGVDSWTADFH